MAVDSWDESLRGKKQALVERPHRSIWKYQIPVLEEFHIELPVGAEVIRFENEGGLLWMWAIVWPGNPIENRRFLAFKTGAEMGSEELSYLGCAPIFIQAELMLYFFEPSRQGGSSE